MPYCTSRGLYDLVSEPWRFADDDCAVPLVIRSRGVLLRHNGVYRSFKPSMITGQFEFDPVDYGDLMYVFLIPIPMLHRGGKIMSIIL